ncbi:MAG TPA: division/cell wall cluster transcriptional repressor MraZ [Acholeplasmataceae bacterium]|jgi:MraZ protein|nr:division/cell wall cluster transcriptional repressor MraZ [Acholeplasmataceae bacterium]
MFIGEFHYNLDDKGRLFIPTAYRELLDKKVVVARGLEKCLYLYSLEEWNVLLNKINELSFTKRSNREFSRMFLSGAFVNEIDSKGRINIDNILISHAQLKKECIILGAGNRIEIWDKEYWNNYYEEHMQIIEDISEELDL